MEIDNLLKEVEGVIANGGVREIRDGSRPRPRDDANKNNASDNRSLNAVDHQDGRKDTTAEDSDPHSGISHLVPARTSSILETVPRGAAGKFDRSRRSADDEGDSLAVSEADQGKEQTDTGTGSELDGARNGPRKPLPHAKKGKTEEDEALDEDGG